MRLSLFALAFGLASIARTAHAQSAAPVEDSIAVRRANVNEDQPQADVLLSWGAGSLVLGTAEGIAGIGGDTWRWFGINTAVWGLIDGIIATPWVLGTIRERRDIERDASLTGDPRAASWRNAIARSQRQRRSYAINLALDVVYVAGGAVLWYFADRTTESWRDFGLGSGMAAVSQGTFLLGFDLVGLVLAGSRTARLQRAAP